MENWIEARGLTKRYKDFSLQSVDLTVPAGSVVGLVGENGAGKTTLLRAILGMVRVDAGTVRLMGRAPQDPRHRTRAHGRRWRRCLRRTPVLHGLTPFRLRG